MRWRLVTHMFNHQTRRRAHSLAAEVPLAQDIDLQRVSRGTPGAGPQRLLNRSYQQYLNSYKCIHILLLPPRGTIFSFHSLD